MIQNQEQIRRAYCTSSIHSIKEIFGCDSNKAQAILSAMRVVAGFTEDKWEALERHAKDYYS